MLDLEAGGCPSVTEWINKLWYIRTMGYYSALKRNELLSPEKTWRKLKSTVLSGRSQPEKAKLQRLVARGLGGRRDEEAEHRGFLGP